MAAKGAGKLKQERINEAIGVLFLLAGLFTLLSLLFFHPSDHSFYTSYPNESYRNVTGIIGARVAYYLNFVFGWSSYSVPAIFLFWASCFFLQKVPQKRWIELICILVSIVAVSSVFALLSASEWKMRAGGAAGYLIASRLETYFGVIGGLIISFTCLALALLLATDFLLYPIFERFWIQARQGLSKVRSSLARSLVFTKGNRGISKNFQSSGNWIERFLPPKVVHSQDGLKKSLAAQNRSGDFKPASSVEDAIEDERAVFEQAKTKIKLNQTKDTVKKEISDAKAETHKDFAKKSHEEGPVGHYQLPPLSLLNSQAAAPVVNEADLRRNSQILEETLRDFGIQVKVVEVEHGPVITRYELLPAPGVKVNRIVSLSDNLALALKTTSIRFLTPIPGKPAVGVEIPNLSTTTVAIRELLESPAAHNKRMTLPLMLGKSTSGKPMIADLVEMPHLLIAGTTGSGKTVCLNSLIVGLLFSKTPEELKFIMVDPKMVELSLYQNIPHMMTPVVTDVRKASGVLHWLVDEMERRYRMFAAAGTRNIKAFNERKTDGASSGNEPIPKQLPYILLVIDELADLMMVARDKVETLITRLVQLSRAVGIHLVLATQRPSVDVITGVIKANFPARISFKVASKVDSRTVLDTNGADQLLGKGDLLFLEPGEAKPIRGQGTFISDQEIGATVQFITGQRKAQYVSGIGSSPEGESLGLFAEKDELYHEAVKIILQTRQASVSVLQRRLRLGYGRAARIIDMMESEGIVGPPQGSKPREILAGDIKEVTGSPAQEP